MACTRPILLNKIDRTGKRLEVKCGHCINCLIEKQTQLEFLLKKELFEQYSKGHGASFVTLTYNDDEVPHALKTPVGVPYKLIPYSGQKVGKFIEIHKAIKNQKFKAKGYNWHTHILIRQKDTLERLKDNPILEKEAIRIECLPESTCIKDIQNFLKRVRQNMRRINYPAEKDFKVVYCTEYGGETNRPHAHILFIGLSTSEVETFARPAWKKGILDNGVLTQGGIRYITKYMTKSNPMPEQEKIYRKYEVEKPKICHSIGIGKKWICEHLKEIYENDFKFNCGKMGLVEVPKYVKRFIMHKLGIDNYKYAKKSYEINKWKLKPKWNDWATYEDWQIEQNLIKEQMQIDALRSQGLSWNNNNKGYLKPRTKKEIQIEKPKIQRLINELDEFTKMDINLIKLSYYFEQKSLEKV